MKNNFYLFNLVICFVFFFNFLVNANEVFNFNVSEIEISDNGKKIKGLKRLDIISPFNMEVNQFSDLNYHHLIYVGILGLCLGSFCHASALRIMLNKDIK